MRPNEHWLSRPNAEPSRLRAGVCARMERSDLGLRPAADIAGVDQSNGTNLLAGAKLTGTGTIGR
jgi:hypothetical protein